MAAGELGLEVGVVKVFLDSGDGANGGLMIDEIMIVAACH